MSRKNKNQVDIETAVDLLVNGYGIMVKQVNYYQMRLWLEDNPSIFFDWYHTTGSLVKTQNGYPKSMGKIKDVEDLAIFIKKTI